MNNKYDQLPAFMSDGRFFTDYRPNHDINESIKKCYNAENEDNYRNLLYLYGNDILKKCDPFLNKPTSAPFNNPESLQIPQAKYIEECDKKKCKKTMVNPTGIGTERVFLNTDCKTTNTPTSTQ
jgi:hypothetical protein